MMVERRVFVASPSDVQSERDLLESVVDEINDLARSTGQILRLIRWEKDVRPGVGEDPQDVIDRQVGVADVTIVIFWKRLGTPSERAASGTVAEFRRAVMQAIADPEREVFTYFKTALIDLHKDDLAQAAAVRSFKDTIAPTTLISEFRNSDQFRRLAGRHLLDVILSRMPRDTELAAEGEDPRSDFVRGLLAAGNGTPEDAARLLRLAAARGHDGAALELGMMLRGQGDVDGADGWFRQAARDGNATAAYNVGLRLRERDEAEDAEPWLRSGAEGGDVASMYNLGMVLEEKGDSKEAERWLLRGAEGGDVQAMYNFGRLRRDAGDRAGGELWLRRGAEGGDVAAMEDLAKLLKDGYGDDEATVWLERSRAAANA